MAPAPTTATTSATRPAIINSNPNLNNLHRNRKNAAELPSHCSEHVGKFTTCHFRPERSHPSNIWEKYLHNVYTLFFHITVKKMTATRVEI
jgi:hypothetical protein